ncbi:MAG: hypothetical protein WCY48_09085 [Candidatus Caldatribacteriota bacterium]
MKATFFKDNIEWQVTTAQETWTQGDQVSGEIKLKNHSPQSITLENPGLALTYTDIKKVQARETLKPLVMEKISLSSIGGGEEASFSFSLKLPDNCPVTDKKSSFYLSFGPNSTESHLQLNILPLEIFTKVISLFDTFFRFKVKDIKGVKAGVEYKLTPPTSRDFANVEQLLLEMQMKEEILILNFKFSVKKLDMSGISTKMMKENVKESLSLTPKEYSLGRGMIHQDQLLKSIESVLNKIKANTF